MSFSDLLENISEEHNLREDSTLLGIIVYCPSWRKTFHLNLNDPSNWVYIVGMAAKKSVMLELLVKIAAPDHYVTS